MLDRAIFFTQARNTVFGGRLLQGQVDGMNSILDEWEASDLTDLRWLAYILAGVVRETGRKMEPVREGFAADDATARSIVYNRSYGKPVNGIVYYGRGRIQNTWVYNYRKLQARFGLPFVTQPDLLLDDKTDAKVTLYGHVEGIWTGRKLADYFNGAHEDPEGARHIVNGTDHAAEIAGYYWHFKAALTAAWFDKLSPAPGQVTPPAIIDHPNTPDPLPSMKPPVSKIEPVGSALNASTTPSLLAGAASAFGGVVMHVNPGVLTLIVVAVAVVFTVAIVHFRRKQPATPVQVKK